MRFARKMMVVILLSLAGNALQAQFATDSSDYPAWMKDAVIYGIKPSSFVKNGTYDHITAKIPDLRVLGINVIWLQPVYKTKRGGQGYDVTDYFSLRPDLGTPEQLKNLVAAAKANGIRVLFDFVPNHTSIDHPYAVDCRLRGEASPYFDYYQHSFDSAPYSSYYHKDDSGFVFYFWKDLVNLNFDNPKVRRMIIDACVYWVKEYGIDGYRFDAVWAVNARAPDFGRELRSALRSVKPDILLLAEDKGRSPDVYRKGFDAAYDWTADTGWVSHWAWQYEHHEKLNFTVFNHPRITQRKQLLSQSLFSDTAYGFRLLRFLENNDLPRFIVSHSTAQTRMAATILFSLPGIPLLFCGQEIGARAHPYSRQAIFDSSRTIREQDSLGMYMFYQDIISKRARYASLRTASIREVPVAAPGVIAYTRENIIVIANLDSLSAPVNVSAALSNRHARKYRDILSGKKIKFRRQKNFHMQGYASYWLIPNGLWRRHQR